MTKEFKWRERYQRNHHLMDGDILRVFKDEPSYQRVVPKVRLILRRYLATARAATERAAHKLTAEQWLFRAASDKNGSFRSVTMRFGRLRALFDELSRAGFNMLHSEVHIFVEYGYCCHREGKKEVGLQVLEEMRSRLLAENVKPGPTRYYREIIYECATLLSGERRPKH